MESELLEELIGEFTHTIYKSDKYMVSKFKTNEGTITVTGPFFDYERNVKYVLTGSYVEHPRFGFQFSMIKFDKYLSDDKKEIISFLKSSMFKGIGNKAAKKIFEHFGKNTLNLLKENPLIIEEVNITDKQKISIQEGFASLNDPEKEIIFYLVSNGFTSIEAQKIFNRFKLVTIDISKDNPFKYYNDVDGVSFDKVKSFASRLDFSDREDKFSESFLIYLLTEISFNTGDMYITKDNLIKAVNQYGRIDNFDEVLNKAIEHNYIVNEDDNLYLYDDYEDEKFIANRLLNFNSDLILDSYLIEEGIENNENLLSIKYDDKQKQAITNFFNSSVSIITGGPGTGKTTIVKTMVNMFKDYFPYNNLIVVAPTGRAAKRINEICDCESKTIHSLLRWNLESNTFGYDIDNPLIYDAIIIDEFSMVDNSLFASLLKASNHVKKICIIGDQNQLPSIRPGFVLNDLIESNLFNCVNLCNNYRQANGNEIIDLANDIINKNVDLNKYHNDVSFIDIRKQKIDLVKLIENDINDGYILDDIQVLAPMYKGEFGIDNLNVLLQNKFNPKDISKNEKQIGKYIFRENDKILQLKNRPNDDVYNGDIGILEDVDLKEKSLLVNYQGTYVFYNYDELIDCALAYAMSVHKSQGSEYKIVYFVLSRNNIFMINKNLIYTAISRAKIKLVIISEESVFIEGLAHNMRKRNTTLLKRLNEYI